MTTILGIQTNEGVEGIVLASDKQINFYVDDKLIGRKKHGKKIIIGSNYALAHAGTIDNFLLGFNRYLITQKKEEIKNMILKAVEKYKENPTHTKGWGFEPHFYEINSLNTAVMNRREDENGEIDIHDFILAVNLPELGLYRVDGHGNLKESSKNRPFKYLSIGSGSDKVYEYISGLVDNDEIDPSHITIPIAIQIVKKSFKKAEEEINTDGIPDYVILTKDSIRTYGDEIRKSMEDAYEKILNEIGLKYEVKEKPRSDSLLVIPPEVKEG